MDRLIQIQKEDPDAEKEYMEASEDIARQYAPPLREMVRKALVLLAEEQYEKAAGLCCRILDEDDTKPEIREALGICYFSLGNMASAAMVFSDLVRDYPDEEEYHRIYWDDASRNGRLPRGGSGIAFDLSDERVQTVLLRQPMGTVSRKKACFGKAGNLL